MAPTALIVDDALFMRMMIRDILVSVGIEVVGEAENGRDAVDEYERLKPDLVTMDIVMPEVDGIEAVKRILEADPEARIIMCSAMGQQPLVVEALEAGARDFIVKPFQPSKVIETVRKTLER
ncbi:MAG: response regulator [Candidatus Geothermincolia bacterium]